MTLSIFVGDFCLLGRSELHGLAFLEDCVSSSCASILRETTWHLQNKAQGWQSSVSISIRFLKLDLNSGSKMRKHLLLQPSPNMGGGSCWGLVSWKQHINIPKNLYAWPVVFQKYIHWFLQRSIFSPFFLNSQRQRTWCFCSGNSIIFSPN